MQESGKFIPYEGAKLKPSETLERSLAFYQISNLRRSVRDFSSDPVDIEVINNIIKTAGTAPSGAHKQPWTFCVISNPELKKQIRVAAEQEEYESYQNRMSEEWLQDLAPLGTDWNKPFLENAPWLIIVFKRVYEYIDGKKWQNYYVNESVGIACGMLISAIHNAGLVTLTHTPSPMNFLTKILDRPDNERPYLLMPVGHAAPSAQVPDLSRKTLEELTVLYT
jgi:iodotyrosine deiodinase